MSIPTRTLYSDVDRSIITDHLWGIYYKPDFNFGGVQGGAMPFKVKADPAKVKIDPYGPESPDFVVGDDFAHMWCSALAFCQKRFEGKIPLYKKEPSGGIGSFTADSFPVFDRFCDNVYVIADSNHGYKMIGVGELVAEGHLRPGRASCWSRSASRASRRASCIRRPTARSRGADGEAGSGDIALRRRSTGIRRQRQDLKIGEAYDRLGSSR